MKIENKIAVDELIIEVTQKCNLRCNHCMRDNACNLTISNNTINVMLNQISRINRLIITGGESLIELGKINYLLKVAREYNIPIYSWCIVTNGTIRNNYVFKTLGELNFYCLDSNNFRYSSKTSVGQLVISDDKFHKEAREKAEITEREFKFNKDDFELFTIAFGIEYIEYEFNQLLDMGRAKNLNVLNKIEVSLEPNFYLIKTKDNGLEIKGILYMDANGNITPMNLSYEEQYKHIFGNIYKNTLTEIAFNIIPENKKVDLIDQYKNGKQLSLK
jgi:MoaA/NifB/PqqE/SkfB family radical SAM enzyme